MKSLQLAKPHLIVVVGIPGAGKTFFAEQFSKTFSAPFLHDSEIRSLLSDDASATKVYDYTLRQLCMTQRTIIVEGRGNSRAERTAMVAQMYPLGYDIVYVWVQTESITAEARAQRSTNTPKRSTFEALTPNERHVVISGRHTYASQAKNVLKNLLSARIQTTAKSAPVVPNRAAPAPVADQFGRVRQGRLRIN